MQRRDLLIVIAVGLVILVAGALVADGGNVPGWEESVFHGINGLPDWLYPIVWPGNLLGALVIVPIVAVLAVSVRQYWLAVAIVIAGVAKLVSERVVKAVVTRERPGSSIGMDIETRGDVSVSGESFVSGHAILVAAVATVVAPYVPPRGRIALGLVVVFVMFARVYVGAHNPLDVICGAALGVAIGAAINLALSAPRRSRVAQQEVDDLRPDDLRAF
ncbi:MAG TPA: phosphatase PAP2 family protein [Desertimonas sp.]|nr:phosphatase PAP2 family protein [Desertimonas sp.]